MPDKEDQGKKKKWYILDGNHIQLLIVLLVAILFYVGLNHFDVVTVRIDKFMGVLSPFIVGFAIAYLLNTPMCFFERKLFANSKYKRVLSILLVYVLAFAVVAILLGTGIAVRSHPVPGDKGIEAHGRKRQRHRFRLPVGKKLVRTAGADDHRRALNIRVNVLAYFGAIKNQGQGKTIGGRHRYAFVQHGIGQPPSIQWTMPLL